MSHWNDQKVLRSRKEVMVMNEMMMEQMTNGDTLLGKFYTYIYILGNIYIHMYVCI